MILHHRPLVAWPGKFTDPRQYSPFRASWSDTLELLDRELTALKADPDTVVLQVAVGEHECRLDGQLRANARPPSHPGVILSFEPKGRAPMSIPCDAFESNGYRSKMTGWQHNVRAIALGLEALRKVERYGIAPNGEQYRGWTAIGSGTPVGAAGHLMTVEEAARFIVVAANPELHDAGRLAELADVAIGDPANGAGPMYKRAAKRLHPDVGGDPSQFRRLTDAMQVLVNQ